MKKFTLFAVAIMASAAMFAEGAFTIEKLWESTDVPAVGDSKQGVGYDGTIFLQDKGSAKIWAYTKDGKTEYAASHNGQGMAIDNAGNMVVRTASSAGSFYENAKSVLLYKKGETTPKTVEFTLDPIERADYIYASGDFYSEKGGYVYFYCKDQTVVSYLKITNGAATEADVTVGTLGTGWPTGTSTVVLLLDTKGNLVGAPRSSNWKEYNFETGELTTFSQTLPQQSVSTLGATTFELGGKVFWGYNIKETVHYNSTWNLYNLTDEKFVSEEILALADKEKTSSAYANWLSTQVIDEKTAYIYQFHPGNAVALWKITYIPAEEPEVDPEVPTAVENNAVAVKVQKIIRDGQVLMIRDGKTYNMMGQEIH
jgi:hypothetical protein